MIHITPGEKSWGKLSVENVNGLKVRYFKFSESKLTAFNKWITCCSKTH